MGKSKMDIAYDIIKAEKSGLQFDYLWKEVGKVCNLTSEELEENISSFYTDLSLDGRFITLGDLIWDLREKHSFDKVHIDMNEIYTDNDEDIVELEEGIVSKGDLDEKLFEEEEEEEKAK